MSPLKPIFSSKNNLRRKIVSIYPFYLDFFHLRRKIVPIYHLKMHEKTSTKMIYILLYKGKYNGSSVHEARREVFGNLLLYKG